MTDKKPVKRGVLSGLMGLFGEENADGQPTVASSPAAPPSATPQMASVIRNQAAPAPDGPPPSDVVREAYEPGWYRISAAMPSAAGEANVEDEEEEPATFAGAPASSDADTQDSAVEQPVGEPPPGEPAGPEPEPEPAPEPDHEEPSEPGPEPEEPSAAEPDPEEPAGPVAEGTEEAAEGARSEPLQPVASFQVSEQEEPQAIPDQIPDAQPQPLPHQMADREPQLAPAGSERMLSRDPAERRAALEAIVGEGITDRNVETVSLLVQDPDRELRLEALGALAHVADLVQPELIRRALDDPSDEVRAAAVHLAARRGTADVPEALTFVAERHWPAAQLAALDSAPGLMARSGISDDVLQRMLRAIGAMDSQPLPHEHDGFVASAQAIGMPQLVASLSASGGAGLGAARLLLAEGSSEAVSALTRHQSHGDSAMQAVVEQAAERLRETAPEPTPESAQLPEEPTPPAPEQPTETEAAAESASAAVEEDMLTGLARALEDPGPSVRDRAREALASLGHDQVVPWIQAALSSGEPERMALGARVAGATRQQDLAPALVARALVAPPDTRSVMVRALAELAVAPESYVQLLSSAPSDQRPDAVRLLWQVAGRAVIPQIHAFLEDPSAQVRLAALEVLGESGEPDAAEVARTVLERDSSPVVRATAIRAIARAGLDQRESSLARALSDPDPDVRAMAVEVLPSGFGGHAAQLVLQALSDEDERVRQAAVAP